MFTCKLVINTPIKHHRASDLLLAKYRRNGFNITKSAVSGNCEGLKSEKNGIIIPFGILNFYASKKCPEGEKQGENGLFIRIMLKHCLKAQGTAHHDASANYMHPDLLSLPLTMPLGQAVAEGMGRTQYR